MSGHTELLANISNRTPGHGLTVLHPDPFGQRRIAEGPLQSPSGQQSLFQPHQVANEVSVHITGCGKETVSDRFRFSSDYCSRGFPEKLKKDRRPCFNGIASH